jgi:outer membrane lipoprotein-sorting protein
MHTLRIALISTLILLNSSMIKILAQDANTLLQNMDNIMFSPKDKQGTITIILIDKSGKEKVREAIMKQKGTDKKLFRYTQPESQAGIATLSLPDGIMWMYMPAFGKPKKISLLAKSQAFTGTDFSYEDMATEPYARRYTPVLIETHEAEYILELTPISEKSDYSKIIVTLDKTHYYPLLMEYFDRKGKKFKEATYIYHKIGPYWNAEEVEMTNLKKNHTTKIMLTDVKFDQGLTDEEFTVEAMVPEEKQ